MKLNKPKYLKTIWSHFIGLMFHSYTSRPYVFHFSDEKKIDLHTFFCFYTLYIYFLDKNKKVVEVKKMKPFRIYWPKKKSKYIVESMEDLGLFVGDKVNF